ncbi:oxidoreductase [Geobacter sp.]|uniref:oxidoreductase n=1 Tax=Geobacter sp. TaxID=46610 RepID=UPI0027BB1F27|nr:oxidoreductase [Geobacter sp.]
MKCTCCCKSDKWTTENIGDQTGKNAIVTGANSGVGYHTALELGRAGANVVIASRDEARGNTALKQLRQEAPGAKFRLEFLDLSDLMSVRLFAEKYLATNEPLDILVNNAGIMALPERELTVEGFEKQFGTNHLGHFALTGLLLPALQRSKTPRVVSVSSAAATWGKIELDNLQSERLYKPMRTYGQSKLANLAFMLELGRRFPWLTSVASHPGATVSNLQKHKFECITKIIGQHGSQGALPSLRASVEETRSGTYYGPKSWFQMRGTPVEVKLPCSSRKSEVHSKLWEKSEQLTGVCFQC